MRFGSGARGTTPGPRTGILGLRQPSGWERSETVIGAPSTQRPGYRLESEPW